MRTKTSAALLLVAVFLLGGVAGGVSHYIYQNHLGFGPPPRAPLANSHNIVEEMAQSLNLDNQQKDQLKIIIQQSRVRYDGLAGQFRPQYEKIRSESNEAIRALLRPDQRLLFDKTLEKMDSRRRGRPHEPVPDPSKK